MTKPKTAAAAGGGSRELTFITSTSDLNEFSKKENKTTVRKQAMDFHLTSEGKGHRRKSESKALPRNNSAPSDASSAVSQDWLGASSTNPTTVSLVATSRASVSSSHESFASNHHALPVARRRSPEGILPAGPIVQPSGKGPLPYDNIRPPLFESIGKSLDPFGTMFQARHPLVSVEHLKLDCSKYFGTKSLGKYWIPTALDHPHTFLGTLCLATAYNDVLQELTHESVQTVALRQEVIHLVGRKLQSQSESIAHHNFMAVIQLIISEIIGREEFGLNYHLNGIEKMISLKGGLNQIKELDGRLANSITWICIANSILHEKTPSRIYLDHATANSKHQYPQTATIPESPLYLPYPRLSFQTLQNIPACAGKTLELLNEVRSIIDMSLHQTKQARRNSDSIMNIYRRITNFQAFPPISQLGHEPTEVDNRYEAIRIAAVIQATAIAYSMPLSKAIYEVAAQHPRTWPSLNTQASAARYSEPSVSSNNLRRYSQAVDTATSPIPSLNDVSPSWQMPNYSAEGSHRSSVPGTHRSSQSSSVTRPSISTAVSSESFSRPSISSAQSASSDFNFFPPREITLTNTDLLLQDIREAISKSNMSQCWDGMAGVLLWIGLVVGAATKGVTKEIEKRVLRRFFSAITMRSGIILCFEHPEAINATVLRMNEIIEMLDDKQVSSSGSKTDRSTKRQKFQRSSHQSS